MSDGEQAGSHAVPLAEAATRLGVTSDALRMRIRRGTAKGFKRGRQVYVWLPEESSKTPSAAALPKTSTPPSSAAPPGRWPAVVEVQKEEIARLIAETERLNARLDRHLDEAREMRLMLQREQVLRQQEQSLRHDVQRLLDRLLAYPAILSPRLAAARTPFHADPRDENFALAEMLKEIGQSLREIEARDPGGPGATPGKPSSESSE